LSVFCCGICIIIIIFVAQVTWKSQKFIYNTPLKNAFPRGYFDGVFFK